jgi:cytochrome c oxidase assembly protein subunit 11
VQRLPAQTVEDKIRARQENPDAATEEAAAAREITVTFNADVNDGMPWRFLPSQRAVKVMVRLATSLLLFTCNVGNAQHRTGHQEQRPCICFLALMQIRPGQSTLAFFTAENTSNKVITGVSTYNVTPQQAGTYFNKIQCFCFEVRHLVCA